MVLTGLPTFSTTLNEVMNMKNKRVWLAIVWIMIALFVLAPASLLAEGPDPVTLAPAGTETITGVITAKDNTIPGNWELSIGSGDVTVHVGYQTHFRGSPATMNVGDTVKVTGSYGADGIFYATKVEKTDAGGEQSHFSGLITEIADGYWVVAGRTVLVTADTVLLGDSPDVGDFADVMATQTSEGLVADRIFVKNAPSHVQFMGVIAEMADDYWVVTTPIGDMTVGITADTVIEGGDPDVGDIVKVTADVEDGEMTATRIVVKDELANRHIRGTINEIADDYWVINRATVLIDENTVIEGDEPDVGDIAEAWVTVTPDGLLATRIVVSDYPRLSTLKGVVEAIEGDVWTVSGRDVLTNEDTVIIGHPEVGDEVSVIGMIEDDGTFLARFIYKQVEPPEKERLTRFSGFITDIIAPAVEGDPTLWVVRSSVESNGYTETFEVWISDTTVVDAKVDPAVGVFVKGYGHKNDDGSIDARKVQVIEAPKVPFMGVITQRPETGAVGEWIIGGVTVYVTEDTEVMGDVAAWGDRAKGYGVLQADGSVEALVIGSMPGFGGALPVAK